MKISAGVTSGVSFSLILLAGSFSGFLGTTIQKDEWQKDNYEIRYYESRGFAGTGHVKYYDLHHAAFFGHAGVARLLIAAGAKFGAKDGNGATPLQVAYTAETRQLLEEARRQHSRRSRRQRPPQEASKFDGSEFVRAAASADDSAITFCCRL